MNVSDRIKMGTLDRKIEQYHFNCMYRGTELKVDTFQRWEWDAIIGQWTTKTRLYQSNSHGKQFWRVKGKTLPGNWERKVAR